MTLEQRAILAGHVDRPLREVAARLGTTPYALFEDLGVEGSDVSKAVIEGIRIKNKAPAPSTVNLLRDHFERGIDAPRLAKKYGLSLCTVEDHLRVRRGWWMEHTQTARKPSVVGRAILRGYFAQCMTRREIAEKFGVGLSTVDRQIALWRDWWENGGRRQCRT